MEEKLEFVRARLGVSDVLIAEAQSYKAKYEGNAKLEIAYLAAAGKWDRWHHVVVNNLVPKLVSDGEEGILLLVLNDARKAGLDTSTLLNWELRGGFYELYAATKDAINTMQYVDLPAVLSQLEELRQRLLDISSSEEELNLRTHAKCTSEIGAWVSTRLLELKQVVSPSVFRCGSILDLPMWEDRRNTTNA